MVLLWTALRVKKRGLLHLKYGSPVFILTHFEIGEENDGFSNQ